MEKGTYIFFVITDHPTECCTAKRGANNQISCIKTF